MMILVTREAERLLDAALDLPEDERAELAAILSESVGHDPSSDEIEAEWIAEAKRRLEDVRAGRATTIPSEDVERELEEIIAAREAKRAAG
jgi:putative addiction module component (TIGR02574 family)